MTAPLSHRESDDDYRAVVVRLNPDWRVIVCKDGIQWILQKRAKKAGGAGWYGSSYCRTREALIRFSQERSGQIDPIAKATLESLSAWIHKQGQLAKVGNT